MVSQNNMSSERTFLETDTWPPNERALAEANITKLGSSQLSPQDRRACLQALIANVANINDVAVTRYYAERVGALSVMKKREFISKVDAWTDGTPSKTLNANHTANDITGKHRLIYLNDRFHKYEDGVYRQIADKELEYLIKEEVRDKFSTYLSKEVRAALAADAYIGTDSINILANSLNVKNGMLDLGSITLNPHHPNFYSTVQIDCAYDEAATCPMWCRFLDEVLGDDTTKISILQEFFGYCLSSSTEHESALMLLGDGANGKSVTMNVLGGMLGSSNTTSVPLEQFKNQHYVAQFHGSKVNICYESNTKTTVYESTFKQLVSGETISADHKYGHPFKFRNTCKLIFAFNNFPRIDDTTDAFYRRIIPIPFNLRIPEEKRDKGLSRDLLLEKSGILNWSLSGYKRLRARGGFTRSPSVQALIEEYRKDNNNVMTFMDEMCVTSIEGSIPKGVLYEAYRTHCKESGTTPLTIIKFSKQLKKLSKAVREDRGTDGQHLWLGVRLK